jgi:hypothetical protein
MIERIHEKQLLKKDETSSSEMPVSHSLLRIHEADWLRSGSRYLALHDLLRKGRNGRAGAIPIAWIAAIAGPRHGSESLSLLRSSRH